jgi:hypothetical protein
LRENAWKDKEGNSRKEVFILASDIEFVQKPQDDVSKTATQQSQKSADREPTPVQSVEVVNEEDLEQVPF